MYEMLTRARAFAGDSSASVIAAIMNGARAPLESQAPDTPPALIRLIDRCLAVDPRDRWQSAGDLAYALRDLAGASQSAMRAGPLAAPRTGRRLWLLTAAAVAGAASIGIFLLQDRRPADATELRLSLVPPDGLGFSFDAAEYDPEFAVSPDGRKIVFVALDAANARRLFVRDLASVIPREIAGTLGARRPFWSPDGRSIGYMTGNGMNRVMLDAGAPQPVSSTVVPTGNASGTWTLDGRIIFEAKMSREGPEAKGLFEVPVTGGTAKLLSRTTGAQNEQAQRYPVALPGGRHYLYLSWTPDPAERAIYLGSFDSNERSLLVRTGFRAGFVAPDTLVYVRDRVLVAQRFSIEDAALIGEPRQLAFGVAMEGIPGQATFDVSASGVLAYRSRSRQFASELRWIDRSGQSELVLGSRSDIAVALAPDGRRVALARLDLSSPDDERFSSNVWIYDLGRRMLSRFTVDSATTDENPVWSPDGTQIAYGVHRGTGLADVRTKITGGSSDARVIASGSNNFHPIDWARDGTLLLHAYATGAGADDLDLYLLGPEPDAKPKAFLVARGSQAQGQFSPDSQWIAYVSDESGAAEVYVRPRDGRNLRFQISTDGGVQPRWRRDGRELYYVTQAGTMMAVSVTLSRDDVKAGVPSALFTEPTLRTNNNVFYYGGAAGYDVTADGRRFLVNRLTREPTAGPIHVVLNWPRP
jgi:Tol biopolymer transport system component